MSRYRRMLVALAVATALPGVAMVAAQDGPKGVVTKTVTVKVEKQADDKAEEKRQDKIGVTVGVTHFDVNLKADAQKADDKAEKKEEPKGEMRAAIRINVNAANVVAPPAADAKKGGEPNLDPLIQQFLPQIRPTMKGEIHLIAAVCKPTKEQKAAIDVEGERVLKIVAKEYAAFQHKIQNVGWNTNDRQPDPKALIARELLAAAKKVLPPEQAKLYEAEATRRAEATKRSVARNLVAILDEDLILDAPQRQKLFDSLVANWDEKWAAGIENLMYGNNMFPNVPDKFIGPLLTPSQKKIWDKKPKNIGFLFGGNNFMNGQNRVIDEEAAPAAAQINGKE